MILDDIKNALSEVDDKVYYGAVSRNEISDSDAWNYTVFGRSQIRAGQGRTAYTDRYRVAVVREDYIPDGLAEKIIDAMEKIPGMKFADNLTGEYAYERKGNTNIVCEMLVLEFSRGKKKCANG